MSNRLPQFGNSSPNHQYLYLFEREDLISPKSIESESSFSRNLRKCVNEENDDSVKDPDYHTGSLAKFRYESSRVG